MERELSGVVVDTSAAISLERARLPVADLIARIVAEFGDVAVSLSPIVLAEMAQGVARANTPEIRARRQRFVDELAHLIPVHPITRGTGLLAGRIRGEEAARGNVLPFHDVLIAAAALEQGFAVLTENVRDFERIPGVRVVRFASERKVSRAIAAMPESGAVLGIDVGFSATQKTTGFGVLSWTASEVRWRCAVATLSEAERRAALGAVLGGETQVLAVAVDGPLRPGLEINPKYRPAECILSRGKFQKRGKPGQTNAGSGPELHRAATVLARLALDGCEIGPAAHGFAIHERAIAETFPNLFLGVLCEEAQYPDCATVKRRWTDALIVQVEHRVKELIEALLPGREWTGPWPVRGHEPVASLTCAAAALCLAANCCTGVGSPEDGYILLPPAASWAAWAKPALDAVLPGAVREFPSAQVVYSDGSS